MLEIKSGDLNDPQVIDLLRIHLDIARAQSPPTAWRVPDIETLHGVETSFWTIWDGGSLAGCGALKRLSSDHGEVKAMHTADTMRRRGVGSAILHHIVSVANAEGLARLSLETGSSDYFQPARRLYCNLGFVECEPFAPYRHDPNSMFMSLELGMPEH